MILALLPIGYFSKRIWQMLSGLVSLIFRDLPNIRGEWEASYDETDENGQSVIATEAAQLSQIGRFVWGEVRVAGRPLIQFKLRGEITRNTFVGTFTRTGANGAVGTGAFELIIRENDRAMEGHCIWHDYDTDSIENSSYLWSRKDTPSPSHLTM